MWTQIRHCKILSASMRMMCNIWLQTSLSKTTGRFILRKLDTFPSRKFLKNVTLYNMCEAIIPCWIIRYITRWIFRFPSKSKKQSTCQSKRRIIVIWHCQLLLLEKQKPKFWKVKKIVAYLALLQTPSLSRIVAKWQSHALCRKIMRNYKFR